MSQQRTNVIPIGGLAAAAAALDALAKPEAAGVWGVPGATINVTDARAVSAARAAGAVGSTAAQRPAEHPGDSH
ncbi:MAG TPA: hypothetical protein VGY13_12555 [Solirubrobacteraceae bacterium]|jgi:hypothetical protein|nr:hypothetical protein [Solirubrobacteraceae bacterium]